ncbi:hypothetical protein [Chamaesiphon sp. OTE_8_metabat_110]|uniref:hypothetical protein n=1 Tax=Chamaesiphon sp. OTE_8_metabat_110 TaxID=2964696 RepID=UPI00286C1762|nr:hypothetical protein [Chamaesiphon sp. OTE_8_metabat_110]
MNLPSAKSKPEGEPDWVTADNRRFYKKLANDSVLVGKVIDAIAQHPKDNSALAESLVAIGLHKQDGTALDKASVSRIRTVASGLNAIGG